MTVEATILCEEVAGRGLPDSGPNNIRLRRFGPAPNVFLCVEDLRRATWSAVPDVFLDLLDIAAYVYAADQAVKRGGSTGEAWGEDWRRVLHFGVPVRMPEVWRSRDIRDALLAVLSFLSEDEYHFEFHPAKSRDRFEGYGLFKEGRLDGGVEEITLFSGGLDSLAGAAYECLIGRRKVALLNHRSNPKAEPVLRALMRGLTRQASGAAPKLIQVRVHKDERLTRENTQRTRSFLYAALGAATAAALELNRVRFYENGVVSLNLPYCTQVVGARASRTTHPRVLAGLTRLFTTLAKRPFTVENPFRDRTKADVVRLLAEAGCHELIRHTRSCAHPRAASNSKPHCGVCSQCLDRRLAVLEAGQQAYDPAEDYRLDLLRGDVPQGLDQVMVAVYAETARRVARMSPSRFFRSYGELSRLSDLTGAAPSDAAHEAFRLYQKHAQGVGLVFKQVLAEQAGSAFWGGGQAGWLLRMVAGEAGESASSEQATSPDLAENVFRRCGKVWQVRYAGRHTFVLLPSVGAAYLHVLLQRPGDPLSLFDLVRVVAKDPRRFALPDNDCDLDDQGAAALMAKIQDYREAIEEAKREGNTVDVDVYTRELEELEDELRKNRKYRGKSRRERDPHKRLRSSVLMAIQRVIKKIRQDDVLLAEHLNLKSGFLHCGYNPVYKPNPVIEWDTDDVSDGAQL
ncbi:MAG TPA: 7-cyano-7-deazaguanine synthase [Gemmataceae bacterium]|jgi:7-cyano-7-deazaguanine synthase in queuosine biosynthesis